jgi:hypothetical protein
MKRKREVVIATCPDDVMPEAWEAWMLVRDKKRFDDFTEYALKLMRAQCEKAGITLQQAIDECIIGGWAGFRSSYVKTQTWKQHVEKQAAECGIQATPYDTHESLSRKISESDVMKSKEAARAMFARLNMKAKA